MFMGAAVGVGGVRCFTVVDLVVRGGEEGLSGATDVGASVGAGTGVGASGNVGDFGACDGGVFTFCCF